MSLNNWKMIAQTRSHIFRWRSRFRRRRICLSSILPTKQFSLPVLNTKDSSGSGQDRRLGAFILSPEVLWFALFSIFQIPIMHCLPPKFLHKLLLRNALGNMQTSKEYFTTIVYAKFGGQTECIMDNWKIVNSLRIRELPFLFKTSVLWILASPIQILKSIARLSLISWKTPPDDEDQAVIVVRQPLIWLRLINFKGKVIVLSY